MPIHTKLTMIAIAVLGYAVLGLAQDNTPVPIFTPFPTPSTDPFPFPNGLFCSEAQMGPGPTWRGITIGESTLRQLQALMAELSENYTFNDRGPRGVTFSLPTVREAREKGIPIHVSACIQDNIVTVLSDIDATKRTRLLFLDDWVADLGIPDAVTWDSVTTSRVVFWFEHGVAVTVLVVEPFGELLFPVYFPYQPVDGYETRWPYNRTRSTPMEHHEAGTPPPSEQNPFDLDAMLATITAQPSGTATATSTGRLLTATAMPRP